MRRRSIDADSAGDAGADEANRLCLVMRRTLPREGMIRFVISPEGAVTPDLSENLPGRGFWVSAVRDCLAKARGKRLFDKAARRSVTAADDLEERVEHLLLERCQDALGLARRAGQAVAGFEKARAHVMAKPGSMVLLAADAASDALSRNAGMLVRADRDAGCAVRTLSAAEIGRPFGRSRAVHAVVETGGLARRLRRDCLRLQGFRHDEWRAAS